MSTYITTHTPTGTPTFTTQIPPANHTQTLPFGSNTIIYSTPSPTLDLTTESDITAYAHTRIHGVPEGLITPPTGTAAGIVVLEPGTSTALHRTTTWDVGYVIEGAVELSLSTGDAGEDGNVVVETRVLHAGDTFVQRGTMHAWRNVSEGGGKVRMFCVANSAVKMPVVEGKELGTEWRAPLE